MGTGSSPNWSFNYTPTPAEWNFWFGQKQDSIGLNQATVIALNYGVGSANGIPVLDGNGKIPVSLIPSAVTGVLGYSGGTFTLTANTTSTSVQVTGARFTSRVFWSPMTANAASQIATLFGSCVLDTLLLTHAVNANTDQTFAYFVIL